VVAGLIAIVCALVMATAFGLFWQYRNGRIRQVSGAGADEGSAMTAMPAAPDVSASNEGALTQADIGAELGSRATLVQFSSAFCAPCRATKRILADVAVMVDGVAHVEIDAESRLDLVRRLDVRRTPTTFVLGPDGRVTHRASGQPRKADVIAALGAVL
jgi:thiol-disulfide isomerase/thioredoxin